MDNSIQNHKFYRTFTPFITKSTKTAEKTLNGKIFLPEKEKVYKFSKEFYDYMTAGGVLAIPVLAIAISKKNIFAQLKKTNHEFFKIITNENNGIFNKLSEKIAVVKYNFLKKFWGMIKPLRTKREIISLKLNKNENKSFVSKLYKNINNLFINGKTKAAQRQYLKTQSDFTLLEENIEKSLNVISNSKNGKIKIALPNSVLKEPSELPVAFDLSKTADGKDRVAQIKEIFGEIKALMQKSNGNYVDIAKKITFSCEDIFHKGESTLVSLHKTLVDKNAGSSDITTILSALYNDLKRYRFAEISENMKGLSAKQIRHEYLISFSKNLSELKKVLPNEHIINSHVSTLDKLLQKSEPQELGLLEQLRMLLKCNDINSPIIQEGKKPALLKHFRPDDYMDIKRLINNFSKDIKLSQKTQEELLPTTTKEIKRGGIFTKTLSVLLPAGYLAKCSFDNGDKEDKINAKRNLISFIVGSLTMIGTNYFTMCSQKRSIVYGIIAAFLSSRIAERQLKE